MMEPCSCALPIVEDEAFFGAGRAFRRRLPRWSLGIALVSSILAAADLPARLVESRSVARGAPATAPLVRDARSVAPSSPTTALAALALPVPAIRGIPTELRRSDIRRRLAADPTFFGALSVGRPNRGALIAGLRMPDGPLWDVVDPKRAYGTEETVASLVKAIARVNEEWPATPKLYVGQISAERGGYLRPHRSHQSGRDVDLGYYYSTGPAWYVRATRENLDLQRTWSLVKALSEDANVEAIFMDRSVQQILKEYATKTGETATTLFKVFGGLHDEEPLLHHEWGHLTHMHVRLSCPVARDAGLRAYGTVAEARQGRRARS
jgi:murein endopeptidase